MNELIYINNVKRVSLGVVDLAEFISDDDVVKYISDQFSSVVKEFQLSKLFVYCDNALISFSVSRMRKHLNSSVVYSDVIPMNNAYTYARYEGILFFFHTNEWNHIHHPHIHASYGDDEISIYLDNDSIVGKYKNKTKQKKAKKFVEDHLDDIREEWNRITNIGQ